MDTQAVQAFALEVWTVKQAELVALMVAIGDRLELFAALATTGATDPAGLAAESGLAERPLQEWLYGMAAAGLVEHEAGRFQLPDAAVPVLVDDGLEPALTLLRTGRGVGFDALGPQAIEALERMTGPSLRTILPGMVIPASGVDTAQVARVADIGCGTGVSSQVLADACPRATVVGVDPSAVSLARAQDRAGDRVEFVQDVAENLTEHGDFDLVAALDCLHDMPRPDLALEACREALVPGGAVLVKETRSSGDFERDRRNPLQALNYGFSLTGCLQSGLSTEDGWGLGNTGLHPARLERLATDCGFDSVMHLEIPDPAATYSVLR